MLGSNVPEQFILKNLFCWMFYGLCEGKKIEKEL